MTLRTDIIAMLAGCRLEESRLRKLACCTQSAIVIGQAGTLLGLINAIELVLATNPPITFSTPEQCAHARKISDKVKSLTGACERRLRWQNEQPGQHSAVKIAAHLAIAEAKVAEDWAELQELTKGNV